MGQDKSDADSKHLSALYKELLYWPYTIHQIDDTLDSALIEGRAKQLLFQALNSRSITAFVGTGVSAAYGRMGWNDWKDAQLEYVVDLSRHFLTVSRLAAMHLSTLTALKPGEDDSEEDRRSIRLSQRWLRHQRQVIERAAWDVKNLVNTFNAAHSKKGTFPGGEDLPILFEIAKKLHDLLLRHHGLFFGDDDVVKIPRNNIFGYHPIPKHIFGCRVLKSDGAPLESLSGFVSWANENGSFGGFNAELTVEKKGGQTRNLRESLDEYNKIVARKEARLDFNTLAKTLLIDECPHAKNLLLKGIDHAPRSGRSNGGPPPDKIDAFRKTMLSEPEGNLKRDIDGIQDNPGRYAVLSPFKLKTQKRRLLELRDQVPEAWKGILDNILRDWKDYLDSGNAAPLQVDRLFVTPTSRFLVPMVLQLLQDPFDKGLKTKDFAPPDSGDFVSRRSIIASRLDPLEKVSEQLGIHRYLTTNYDFEIERFYQDKGYRSFDPHRANIDKAQPAAEDPLQFRTNGLGGVMQDMTFQAATATDLLAFAAGGAGTDVSIFHLHGRATSKDDLVATERDYMDLYLRRDLDREVVDESILMAFAATPILFLGLGMQEADVLRPLRQFMSDQDRSVGYRAIVLLPADNDFESRAKTSAALYLRYGAHTIFYGSGEVRFGRAKKNNRSIDWLHRITALICTLSEAAANRLKNSQEAVLGTPSDIQKAKLKKMNAPLMSLGDLGEKVGNLSSDLILRGEDEKIIALQVLLDLTHYKYSKIAKCKFGRNSNSASIKRDISALKIQNCRYTTYRHQNAKGDDRQRSITLDGAIYTSFYVNRLNELLRLALLPGTYTSVSEAQRSLNAMITALDGLKDAFLTASLNAALDSLQQEWRAWWKDWQASPPQREARFEQLEGEKKGVNLDREETERRKHLIFPRREVRHKVESVITDLRFCAEKTAPELGKDLLALGKAASDPNKKPDLDHNKQKAFSDDFQTGVKVFDNFLYDVARSGEHRLSDIGRVFYTVAAERGLGKGVFFSSLSTRLGLTSYMKAAHPALASSGPVNRAPAFVSAIFINLSFATEIASAYDMLIDTLLVSVAQLHTLSSAESGPIAYTQSDKKQIFEALINRELLDLKSSLKGHIRPDLREFFNTLRRSFHKNWEQLRTETESLSRFEKLRHLMHAFKDNSCACTAKNVLGLEIRPRLLICVNAVDILFDTLKRPKNLEIRDFLRFFGTKKTSDVPFDFIAIGVLEKMGGMWSNNKLLERVTCAWPEQSPEVRSELKRKAAQHDIACLNFLQTTSTDENNYVHFARSIEPQQFLVDNFPTLALSLLIARLSRNGKLSNQNTDLIDHVFKQVHEQLWIDREVGEGGWFSDIPPEVNELYLRTRRHLHVKLALALHGFAHSSGIPGLSALAEQEELTSFLAPKKPSTSEKLEKLAALKNLLLQKPALTKRKLSTVEKLLNEVAPELSDSEFSGFRRTLSKLFKREAIAKDLDDWRDLQRVIGGNRFCLTILLAAAENLIFSHKSFVEGGIAANALLENAVSILRNASVGRRQEVVLQSVMSVYRNNSQIGEPDHDHELHQLLLRNIAVLGCPVSPNVLVRLPDIREYFNRTTFKVQLSRRRMVARALAVLSERGLAFRLSPHPKLLRLQNLVNRKKNDPDLKHLQGTFENWPPEREYRYALHRQIQSHCFQRLGHMTSQPVMANSFAPTLYASMPSRVVRLSTEGYLFLRRLLLGLSQYPDIRHEDSARAMPIFTDDDIITRVQALRAGMSLARTCFSIAAVSRFDDEMTGLDFIRKRGHFETYRVRLRWLLRKAWVVHVARDSDSDGEVSVDEEAENLHRVNALYRDEVVWLYNEVAVTSLVQGALIEAIGYARQAIYLNRRIEGESDGGRIHNMLSLNLAIIQLERGRLQSAEVRLNSIIASDAANNKRVTLLADGYLAIIAELRGRRSETKDKLERVIEGLQVNEEDRALAIMTHHLARLVASEDIQKAQHLSRRARAYAEKGGHEDIRYRILVSEVWMSQHFEPKTSEAMQADRVKLREARRYAEVMGLPSLLVDTLHTQATMLLNAGDFSSSGRLMTKAMAIARRNDMTLRLNSIMTNYAKVLLARQRIASAKRLLSAALAMAKRCSYNIEVVRIHEVADQAERQTAAADEPSAHATG